MFSLRKPKPTDLNEQNAWLRTVLLSYESRDGLAPAGFVTDHFSVDLGSGEAVFAMACQAIRGWKMFHPAMAELWPPCPSIEVGEVVSVLFRAGLLWSINPCRILRVIDESGDIARFGFTYGTLPGHIARGEETFAVEWHRATNRVTYSIEVFSRPAHWLAWLGYPYVRFQQGRFRRLSGAAMSLQASFARGEKT